MSKKFTGSIEIHFHDGSMSQKIEVKNVEKLS